MTLAKAVMTVLETYLTAVRFERLQRSTAKNIRVVIASGLGIAKSIETATFPSSAISEMM